MIISFRMICSDFSAQPDLLSRPNCELFVNIGILALIFQVVDLAHRYKIFCTYFDSKDFLVSDISVNCVFFKTEVFTEFFHREEFFSFIHDLYLHKYFSRIVILNSAESCFRFHSLFTISNGRIKSYPYPQIDEIISEFHHIYQHPNFNG